MGGRKRSSRIRIEVLRSLAPFRSAPDHEIALVDRLGCGLQIAAGRRLIKEGTPGRESFLIVRGCVSVYVGGQRVAQLGPGDFFGEMALLELAPRSATVLADTELEVLLFNPLQFAELIGSVPAASAALLRAMSARLRSMQAASTGVATR